MKKENEKILLLGVAALLVGFLVAKVDTSPHWDDTGLIAWSVLAISFVFGFIHPNYAWLWALSVGAPVVLLNIITTTNYYSSAVLLFSFAGAYAGFLMKRVLHRR